MILCCYNALKSLKCTNNKTIKDDVLSDIFIKFILLLINLGLQQCKPWCKPQTKGEELTTERITCKDK